MGRKVKRVEKLTVAFARLPELQGSLGVYPNERGDMDVHRFDRCHRGRPLGFGRCRGRERPASERAAPNRTGTVGRTGGVPPRRGADPGLQGDAAFPRRGRPNGPRPQRRPKLPKWPSASPRSIASRADQLAEESREPGRSASASASVPGATAKKPTRSRRSCEPRGPQTECRPMLIAGVIAICILLAILGFVLPRRLRPCATGCGQGLLGRRPGRLRRLRGRSGACSRNRSGPPGAPPTRAIPPARKRAQSRLYRPLSELVSRSSRKLVSDDLDGRSIPRSQKRSPWSRGVPNAAGPEAREGADAVRSLVYAAAARR